MHRVKSLQKVLGFIFVMVFLTGCGTPKDRTILSPTLQTQQPSSPTLSPISASLQTSQSIESRIDDILARMSLAEKIGQMTQVEKNSINPKNVQANFIGSVLSGGGGSPRNNSVEGWAEMIDAYQQAALATPLGIPILYGVDAVHGHSNLKGATIFPHNIGMGAANDPDLLRRIGRATAIEMLATGATWNFAPVVAVAQDIRWGRTYESYSENTALVSSLASAYIQGLQGTAMDDPLSIAATAKHYLGDGGAGWGTSKPYRIDQGDLVADEATLRRVHLPPYQSALDSGAMIVMASFSSWNGLKMHAQHYLLTEVLKGELGFQGFIVSDWAGIDQIDADYTKAVVTAINAGVDMSMVPSDYQRFIQVLTKAVEQGEVSIERINDAVRRILRVKLMMGLFDRPFADPSLVDQVGSDENRSLAREAVAKSLVLLKNDHQTLPLSPDTPMILVAGQAADDIGIQCGGWTISWQGSAGAITSGTTILEGIQASVVDPEQVKYNSSARFDGILGKNGNPTIADVGIAVIGEAPYAEGEGDSASLSISDADITLLERLRPLVTRLVVVIISGRPLILTEQLESMDALIAAWLPGTEGQGVADGLFGLQPFTGKLSFTWPRTIDQLPFDFTLMPSGEDGPLFPFGFGLSQ